MPWTRTRLAGSPARGMDGQDEHAAEAAGHGPENIDERLGAMDQGGSAVRASHRRHEAHPAVEIAVRHGVAGGLQGIAGGGTAAFRVERRIGQDVIEAFGEGRQVLELAQGARHVAFDELHAVREIVARNVGARQGGELRIALDQRHGSIFDTARDGEADDADARADIEDTLAATCLAPGPPPPAARRRGRRGSPPAAAGSRARRRERRRRLSSS